MCKLLLVRYAEIVPYLSGVIDKVNSKNQYSENLNIDMHCYFIATRPIKETTALKFHFRK